MKYCTRSGSSNPKDLFRFATISGVAWSPRNASAGSPGAILSKKNVSVVTPKAIGIII